jgi:hypothetical protein
MEFVYAIRVARAIDHYRRPYLLPGNKIRKESMKEGAKNVGVGGKPIGLRPSQRVARYYIQQRIVDDARSLGCAAELVAHGFDALLHDGAAAGDFVAKLRETPECLGAEAKLQNFNLQACRSSPYVSCSSRQWQMSPDENRSAHGCECGKDAAQCFW